MTEQKFTTAESIGRLYKELIAEGVPVEVADSIIDDAARNTIRDWGFSVKGASNE